MLGGDLGAWDASNLDGGNSNIFYVHPYLGMISNLTDIFQMGWFNHQLATFFLHRWLMIRSVSKKYADNYSCEHFPIPQIFWPP